MLNSPCNKRRFSEDLPQRIVVRWNEAIIDVTWVEVGRVARRAQHTSLNTRVTWQLANCRAALELDVPKDLAPLPLPGRLALQPSTCSGRCASGWSSCRPA
jgi:hypothetical protein